MIEQCTIADPPADIELGIAREPMHYFLLAPENGITDKTGLIVFITGWGMDPGEPYVREKLMPYLANAYDCLVVSAQYHGIRVKSPKGARIAAPPFWIEGVCQPYNLQASNNIRDIFNQLGARGVTNLGYQFPLEYSFGSSYLSFGLMPALDQISMIGQVLKNYQLHQNRFYLFGTSYGGYITSLLLKLMPQTFHSAIENSGFSKVDKNELNYYESNRRINKYKSHNGISYSLVPKPFWTLKEQDHRHYFRPAFENIRDLTLQHHWSDSKTSLYCLHGKLDRVASYEEKKQFCEVRAKYAPTTLITIEEKDIDGRLFKTLDHGFNASLKSLFDYIAQKADFNKETDDLTDFDRESSLTFDCQDHQYQMKFSKDYSFSFTLNPTL